MMIGRVAFGPTTSAPTPPSGGPIETRIAPTDVVVATRARAYEMAKAEMPPGTDRAGVMKAADEIFAYLMHGRKPTA